MRYEVVIDGKGATLSAGEGHFQYQPEDGAGIGRNYSVAPAGDGVWSILIDGQSYTVTILSASEVSVDGRVFQVEVFDPRSLRGRRATEESSGPQSVAAPMPGRVIRLLVEAGQQVEAGEGLIVVEAMKMQNEMKAPRAGRVASVKAEAGAAVSAGDILVVIE